MANQQMNRSKKGEDELTRRMREEVDTPLGKAMKGFEVPPPKPTVPWLPPSIIGSVTGRSGCGKTTLVKSIVPHIPSLSRIYYCSLVEGNPIITALATWANDNKVKLRIAETFDAIQQAIDEAKTEGRMNISGMTLLIADDVHVGKKGSQGGKVADLISMIYCQLRNYRCHMLFLSQSPLIMSTIGRTNLNFAVTYPTNSRTSVRASIEIIASVANVEEEDVEKAYRMIQSYPHGFLLAVDKRVYWSDGTRPLEELTD